MAGASPVGTIEERDPLLIGGGVPVAIVFVFLTLIYVAETIGHSHAFLKLEAVLHLIDGVRLMYLTPTFTFVFADGIKPVPDRTQPCRN